MPGDRTASVAFCIDDAFVIPATVALVSLFDSWRGDHPLEVYVFHCDVDAGDRELVDRSVEPYLNERSAMHWVRTDVSRIGAVATSRSVSRTTYLRLLLPDLLPDSVDKVVYLDADVLVLADIVDLWTVAMRGRPLMAVDHINLRRPYFNSGVLLIDAASWRAHGTGRRVLRFARDNRAQCVWYDQDALNHVLRDDWGRLDPRWNQLPGFLFDRSWQIALDQHPGYTDLVERPYIVHFARRRFKPWLYPDNPHPFTTRYFEYYTSTCWA